MSGKFERTKPSQNRGLPMLIANMLGVVRREPTPPVRTEVRVCDAFWVAIIPCPHCGAGAHEYHLGGFIDMRAQAEYVNEKLYGGGA